MDDYLSIQKIWQDTDFAEFEITGSSPVITAKTAVYMTDSLIDELFRQITRFLSGEVEECCWANKERGDNSTACLSLRFLRKTGWDMFSQRYTWSWMTAENSAITIAAFT